MLRRTCCISSSRSSSFCPVSFIGKSVRGRSTVSRYRPWAEPVSAGWALPSPAPTPCQRLELKERARWRRPPPRCDLRPHLASVWLTAETRHSSMERRGSGAAKQHHESSKLLGCLGVLTVWTSRVVISRPSCNAVFLGKKLKRGQLRKPSWVNSKPISGDLARLIMSLILQASDLATGSSKAEGPLMQISAHTNYVAYS